MEFSILYTSLLYTTLRHKSILERHIEKEKQEKVTYTRVGTRSKQDLEGETTQIQSRERERERCKPKGVGASGRAVTVQQLGLESRVEETRQQGVVARERTHDDRFRDGRLTPIVQLVGHGSSQLFQKLVHQAIGAIRETGVGLGPFGRIGVQFLQDGHPKSRSRHVGTQGAAASIEANRNHVRIAKQAALPRRTSLFGFHLGIGNGPSRT